MPVRADGAERMRERAVLMAFLALQHGTWEDPVIRTPCSATHGAIQPAIDGSWHPSSTILRQYAHINY